MSPPREESEQIIVRGALRVVLYPEDDYWIAQGIEVDYSACGRSLEEAKTRFERGLTMTIQAHLEKFGSVQKLLRYAPEEVWKGLEDSSMYHVRFISKHAIEPASELPFGSISYLEKRTAA